MNEIDSYPYSRGATVSAILPTTPAELLRSWRKQNGRLVKTTRLAPHSHMSVTTAWRSFRRERTGQIQTEHFEHFSRLRHRKMQSDTNDQSTFFCRKRDTLDRLFCGVCSAEDRANSLALSDWSGLATQKLIVSSACSLVLEQIIGNAQTDFALDYRSRIALPLGRSDRFLAQRTVALRAVPTDFSELVELRQLWFRPASGRQASP